MVGIAAEEANKANFSHRKFDLLVVELGWATLAQKLWLQPQLVMVAFLDGVPDEEPIASNFLRTSCPSMTSPKTTCLPSRWGVATNVMKN